MSGSLALPLLVAVGLLCATTAAKHTSASLRRHPHKFTPGAVVATPRGYRDAGRSIAMNGGVLTLGAYFLEVTVGTGAGKMTFDAIVDTGSSNTALPSVGCSSCQTSSLYNASASPTSSPLLCGSTMCENCIPIAVGTDTVPSGSNSSTCLYGKNNCVKGQCSFGISYGGSGTATAGTTVTDVACIGGLCATSYINQIINEYPAGTQNTGILGLAFPANACNPTCQPTILDSLVAGGALQARDNRFGMCLTAANGGVLDLGFYNETRFYGPLLFTSVILQEWYNIEVLDILVGGIRLDVPQFLYKTTNDAIGSFVDSGTSIVIIAPYAFQVLQGLMTTKFSTLVNVQQLFGVANPAPVTFNNTSDIDAYPRVEFVLRGLTGKADFKVGMTGRDYLMPLSVSPNNTQFALGIMGVPSIGVILGDIIMQNYYIAFDRSKGVLGFAPIRQC